MNQEVSLSQGLFIVEIISFMNTIYSIATMHVVKLLLM